MSDSQDRVHVITHPLIQQSLTQARDRRTDVDRFRALLAHIARLMAFEITRDYSTEPIDVETPLGTCTGARLVTPLTIVPILRAGLGMADAIRDMLPSARVGHLGLYRDEETLEPVTYYNKLPPDIAETDVIVVDPMLATGGSLTAAIGFLRKSGAAHIKILCLVASPEGIAAVHARYPDVRIYTAAIDSHLDERGYIVPGLGDAGDRLYGTA